MKGQCQELTLLEKVCKGLEGNSEHSYILLTIRYT